MQNITPIIELPEMLGPGHNVAWRADLGPNVDQHQIGLNLSRTGSLLHLIGLRGLSIGQEWGEKSEVNFNISNLDSRHIQKSEIVYRIITAPRTEARAYRTGLWANDQWGIGPDSDKKPVGVIVLNRHELGSRIADRLMPRKMSREDAWTMELNGVLKGGLVNLNQEVYRYKMSSHFGYVTNELDAKNPSSATIKYRHLALSGLLAVAQGLVRPINNKD